MRDIGEIVVAVAFALPEVDAEFLTFFGPIGEEIFDKAQNNDFADFKLEVFSRQENFVVGDEGQHALLILWQLCADANPVQFRRNFGGRGSG